MTLPEEIKHLTDDLIIAFYELDEYSQIFSESEERINLLNHVAPNFFVKLHELFWNKFIMTVSRFTDPKDQNKHQNLSLDVLRNWTDELSQKNQKIITDNLLIIKSDAKQIRTFRSKYISHRDLNSVLLDKNNIGTIDLDKIEKIYKLIGDCLNIFNRHFGGSTVYFRPLIINYGAKSLIRYIKEGAIYDEIKMQRKDFILNEKDRISSKFKDS